MIRLHSILLIFLFSFEAAAWGHLSFFATHPSYAKGSLIFDLKEQNSIDYCIDGIDHSDRVALEAEAALNLWLDAFYPYTQKRIHLTRSECEEDRYDLEIFITSSEIESGAFKLTRSSSGRAVSYIRINEGKSLLKLKEIDSKQAIDFLSSLAVNGEHKFDQDWNHFGHQAFWTIYKSLVHELGHAFGLCDTLEGEKTYCDSRFQSNNHPSAVMKTATSYSLLQDDLQGVKTLFTRFLE